MKKILGTLVLSIGATIAFGQAAWTGSATAVTTNSACGVGTNAPLAKLQVHLNNSTGNTAPSLLVSSANGGNGYPNIMEVINYMAFGSGWTPSKDFWVATNGVVGVKSSLRIGAKAANGAYSNYALSVDGDMIAKRCVIQVDNWADYVFADDYSLPALGEVASYVKENKHLPGVPSEAEVKEKGIDMGEMNKIMMQKMEELTLYIIEQDKKIKILEDKIKQ